MSTMLYRICITFLGSIIGFLFYTERQERLAKEAAAAEELKTKKDD